jgi:hypothetical protein
MTSDDLATLREQLERIEQIPVAERPALFTAVNEAIATELSAMEDD